MDSQYNAKKKKSSSKSKEEFSECFILNEIRQSTQSAKPIYPKPKTSSSRAVLAHCHKWPQRDRVCNWRIPPLYSRFHEYPLIQSILIMTHHNVHPDHPRCRWLLSFRHRVASSDVNFSTSVFAENGIYRICLVCRQYYSTSGHHSILNRSTDLREHAVHTKRYLEYANTPKTLWYANAYISNRRFCVRGHRVEANVSHRKYILEMSLDIFRYAPEGVGKGEWRRRRAVETLENMHKHTHRCGVALRWRCAVVGGWFLGWFVDDDGSGKFTICTETNDDNDDDEAMFILYVVLSCCTLPLGVDSVPLHPSTPRMPTLSSVSMLHSRERDMNIYFAIPKTSFTSPVHNRCRWLQHRLWNTVCVGLSCASNNKPIIRRCRSCRCRHHVNGA